MNKYRPKIFVGTPTIPQCDKSAGDTRFLHLLKMLGKRYDVDLFSFWQDQALEPQVQRHLASLGINLLPSRFWGCADSTSAVLTQGSYDLAFFEFYSTAKAAISTFRRYHPQAKVVVDTVDIHFSRQASGLSFGFGTAEEVASAKQQEIDLYRSCDALILASTLDQEIVTSEGNMPSYQEVLPIIMPIRPRSRQVRGKNVLFIGGFGHAPNLDAIQWFVPDIWSEIRKAVPDATLQIIGSDAPDSVRAMGKVPGVKFVGRVPQTEPFLDDAAVSIAPLRFGAGMKGKVCEAMCAGVPVVTTEVGIQGLGVASEEHLLLAEKPGDFAKAVIRLLDNPEYADRIGLTGQRHIAALCSPESAEKRLYSLIDSLIDDSIYHPPVPVWWFRHGLVRASNIGQRLARRKIISS